MDIQNNSHYDMLIVGGGPTGLFAAINMIKLGHSVLIVDKALRIEPLTRATIIQTRTLEILSQLGLIDQYLKRGRIVETATVYGSKGRSLMATKMSNIDSPFNYTLSMRQPWNEQLMLDILNECGASLHRGVVLEELEKDEVDTDSTVALLKDTRSQRIYRVNAKFVLGADGCHSTVRKIVDIGFPGAPFKSIAINCDAIVETDIPTKEVANSFWTPNGGAFITKMDHEFYRISIEAVPGITHDQEVTMEEFEAMVQKIVAPFKIKFIHTEHFLNYKISVRLADTFSKDNIFIAGDAAHIQSPTAGQGLNTALQDCHNLAWKTSLVLKGIGRREELFASYSIERRQAAEHVAKLSTVLYKIIFSTSTFVIFARELLFPLLNRQGWFRSYNTSNLGGVLINYPATAITWKNPTPWSLFPSAALQPGMRYPDADLLDTTTSEPRTLHGITPATGQFYVIFYVPRGALSAWRTLASVLFQINTQVSSVKSFARRFAIKGFNPIQPYIVISDPSSEVESTVPVYVDKSLHFDDKFCVPADDMSVHILRPDGFLGFSRPIDSMPFADIELYFDGFLIDQDEKSQPKLALAD